MNEIGSGSVNSANVPKNDLSIMARVLLHHCFITYRTWLVVICLECKYTSYVTHKNVDFQHVNLTKLPPAFVHNYVLQKATGCRHGDLKLICRLQKLARTVQAAHILLFMRGRKLPHQRKWEMQGIQMN